MSNPKDKITKFNYSKLEVRILESGLQRDEIQKECKALSRKEIWEIIRGKKNITACTALILCKILKCSVRDITELEGVEYQDLPKMSYLEGNRISYQPLKDYLAEFNMNTSHFARMYFDSSTAIKLSKNRNVHMDTIAKICKVLRLPPDHVMKLV